jgi:hypothetical protein
MEGKCELDDVTARIARPVFPVVFGDSLLIFCLVHVVLVVSWW